MQKKRAWPLADAHSVAEELLELLRPDCERIEIAGSIRRQRPQVGDIELLAVSKCTNAFLLSPAGNFMGYMHLDSHVDELIGKGILAYRLNKRGARTYGRWNKLLVHVPSGISVDLFSTTADIWGLSLLVRTGPAEYNRRVMTRFKQLGIIGHAYSAPERGGERLPCPDEFSVYSLLQWPYSRPEERG